MLIHLAPQCHSPWVRDIALISVEIPELAILLSEGKELRTGRPYPNKEYLVASAKADRASKNGFFVESAHKIVEFHVTTKWVINAACVLTSRHKFTVLDDLYDAVSPDATIWYGRHQSWEPRWPDELRHFSPVALKPVLRIDQLGLVIPSQAHFLLPSLERERVLELAGKDLPGNRTPRANSVFKEQSVQNQTS